MKLLYSLLAAPVLVTGLSLQQETAGRTPATPPQPQPKIQGGSSESADEILATWLVVENENEIALAQLAVQKAQDPEVKSFAQAMIDDHGKLKKDLEPFAAKVGSTKPLSEREEMQGQTQGTASTPSRSAPAGDLDHVALIRELGTQCLSSARKELEQKQGAEFDRCFMGMAIGGHMKANDTMTVFQRHASSALKDKIASGQKTVAAHLQEAKTLAKKLESKME